MKLKVWPFSHLFTILNLEDSLPASNPLARPYNFTAYHFINAVLITIPLTLVTLTFEALDPIQGLILGCKQKQYLSVVLRLAWRDIFVTLVFTGAWQHLLYSSRYTRFLVSVKFNKKFPDPSNLAR